MKSKIALMLSVSLALSACGPNLGQPQTNQDRGRDTGPTRAPAPSTGGNWWGDKPGVYTRDLGDGRRETVVVDAVSP